jgi:hypothetical protein
MTSPQQDPAGPEQQDAPAAPPASSAEAEAIRTATSVPCSTARSPIRACR